MLRLSDSYDIILAHSPISEITGHWFEMCEYYAYFRAYGLKSCMLFFAPNVKKEVIVNALYEKYTISIPSNDIIVINQKETLVCCPNAKCIVCDGNFESLSRHGIKIVAKQIYGFGCGSVTYPEGDYKKAVYLLDKRIYNVPYGIHYVKKIYADLLRKPAITNSNAAMLYLTKNCRYMTRDSVLTIIDDLKNDFNKFLIVAPEPEIYYDMPNTSVMKPPVNNLFESFGTYVYTPVPRKFDCSPRFIAECALFDKNILYYHIDYNDKGLETRIQDIENGSCWLQDNDDILSIIKD